MQVNIAATRISDRDIFRALDEHNMTQAVSAEEARLLRLRRQMREQDERRFMDPTKEPDRPDTYVMFAWQRRKWIYITVLRGKVTPKRIARLRHKYRKRVAENEVVRVVELRVARMLGGAGAAPLAPPPSVRPSRLAKRNARIAKEQPVRVKHRRPNTDKHLSKCEYRKRGKRCSFRAPWFIGYTDVQHARRRIVRKRCARHAWDNRFLPPHAEQVVRVARCYA